MTSMSQSQKMPRFKGSMVALVTPMQPDGQLDYTAYRGLIDWHIQEGTDALVVVGTSGESPTVDVDEHAELIRVAVTHAAGRIPVIAGVGANSTLEAIELTRYAQKAGAQAGLSVVPYYNKPSQEGMYQHFKAVQEAVDLPTLLYNVPGRTVADLDIDTIVRLANIPGIIGIKDASGDISRVSRLVARKPVEFDVISGDDPTAAALILLGGVGNISVTANVAPRAMHELCEAALAGNIPRVREIDQKLSVVNKVLFLEGNPVPVKWALAEMGRIQHGLRLPLVQLSQQYHAAVRDALTKAGLL
jgi:4-hydroxy-tetrahydrodipicolinate synthase